MNLRFPDIDTDADPEKRSFTMLKQSFTMLLPESGQSEHVEDLWCRATPVEIQIGIGIEIGIEIATCDQSLCCGRPGTNRRAEERGTIDYDYQPRSPAVAGLEHEHEHEKERFPASCDRRPVALSATAGPGSLTQIAENPLPNFKCPESLQSPVANG